MDPRKAGTGVRVAHPRRARSGSAVVRPERRLEDALVDYLDSIVDETAWGPEPRSGVPGDKAGAYLDSLGPDLFNSRHPDRAPSFLKGFYRHNVEPTQQWDFFRRISLTRPAPTEPLDVDDLDKDKSSVIRAGGKVAPKVWKSQWYGGPLREDVITSGPDKGKPGPMSQMRANLAWAAKHYAGQARFVVFTDVPRADFDRVRDRKDARGLSRYDAGVWEMDTWARDHGIDIANYFEVFNAEEPGQLMPFIRAEQAKPFGAGKAAMSDAGRFELEYELGGGYNDLDNPFGPGLIEDMHAALASDAKFGRHPETNTIYFAASGNYAFQRYRWHLAEYYNLNQGEIVPDGVSGTDEVRYRTGRAMGSARQDESFPKGPFTAWRSITQESAKSWKQLPEPAGEMTEEQTRALTRGVVATLVRELWNREGDLDLDLVAPAVRAHPHPETVWNAAIRFIYSKRALRERVRTVTDARRRDDGKATPVLLPEEARRLLNIPATLDGGYAAEDPSRWPHLERRIPATFHAQAPAPVGPEDAEPAPLTWQRIGPALRDGETAGRPG